MLVNNITDFVKYIPTAEGTEWAAIASFMAEADAEMALLSFGYDLMTELETIQSGEKLREVANKLHCLMAYHNAIPFADLIQTSNGFAVISNSNQAPASKERVDRLHKWCENQIHIFADMLILQVRSTPALLTEWKKFSNYITLNNCLFFTGHDFVNYAKIDGSARGIFLQAKPVIVSNQLNILGPVISVTYLEQLISEVQNNSYTSGSLNIIDLCKRALGQIYNEDRDGAVKTLNQVSRILDTNLITYTTYAASSEYRARSSANYENAQADSTYFFGV